MRNWGCTAVHEFLGDFVVYRSLIPLDQRLPPLAEIRSQIGLPADLIPRKSAPEYASVIVYLLRQARALDAPRALIDQLIYVGDTQLNDGTAFTNICRAGDWTGLAFIGSERGDLVRTELREQREGALYLANRWAVLYDFDKFCREHGCPPDERTAVIVDLDKTTLGARGRNDHVIDLARVEAVRSTVSDLLDDEFDPEGFQAAYDCLNQPEFHPFTADNQDYLAYICLILGSGLKRLETLVNHVRDGRLTSFQQFISEVDARANELPGSLSSIHSSIYARVQQGDPTPFKAFRHSEYWTTVGRMGWLDDDTPVAELLASEIVITQEVRELSLAWRAQGALIFGLSDKPDEASVPSEDLAARGYRPIHRVETHAIGG